MLSPISSHNPLEKFQTDFAIARKRSELDEMRIQLRGVRRIIKENPIFAKEGEKLQTQIIQEIAAAIPKALLYAEEGRRVYTMITHPPVGIVNRSANCAFNALLQLFANSSLLLAEILTSKKSLHLGAQLRNYSYLQKRLFVPPPDSELFRNLALLWIRKKVIQAPPLPLRESFRELCYHWSKKSITKAPEITDQQRFDELITLWVHKNISQTPPEEHRAVFRSIAGAWLPSPTPDSQLFRKEVHEWTKGAISPESHIQVDVADLANAVLQKLNEGYMFVQTITRPGKDPSVSHQFSPLIRLEVRGSLTESLNHFFSSLQEGESRRKLRFVTTPPSLRFLICRGGQAGEHFYKITDPIEAVPTYLTLPSEYVTREEQKSAPREKSSNKYQLTGSVIHRGENFQSGHYIALIYKNDQFYLLDDETRFLWKGRSWHILNKNRQVTVSEALRYKLLSTRHLGAYLTKEKLLRRGALLNHLHLSTPQEFLGESYLLNYQQV